MTVIFLHIPKTAGTTLRQIISRQYMPEDIYLIYEGNKNYNHIKDFLNLSENDKRKIKVLAGHISFGFHEQLFQNSSYITFLRDPVERIISLYFHIMTHYTKKENQISLFDFLERKLVPNQISNHQTKIISGMKVGPEKCNTKMLNVAKNNIRDHFCVFGLTERFDESLILLRRELGWRTPFYIKDNISTNRPKKQDFLPDVVDLVMKYNELDIELYQYTEDLLDQRIKNHGKIFYKELEEFRTINSFSSNWISPTTIWKKQS